jgi:geranylgeranyl diphosphate synthase, type II
MKGAATSLDAYLAEARDAVEAALERYLPAPPDCPPQLAEALRYSLLAGGKRLRPVLTLAAADAVARGHPEARGLALPAACAIEMIHTYSLVHDDLPAMDDDSLRRGRPTTHVVYGEGVAILVGDGLLTEAFGLLAREPAVDSPAVEARKVRTIALIARAAGALGMVGGQALDLAAGVRSASGTEADVADALRDLHSRKTGALIRAATCAGALMAGAADDIVAAIDRYAEDVGLAFQIVDDILDVEAASGTLGKTAGKDAMAGKLTYPAVHGLEASRRHAAQCVARAQATLAEAGLTGHLSEIAAWVQHRTH